MERPIKTVGTKNTEVETTLRVLEWTPEMRSKRVWRRLAKWWGAALLAALVPPHIPWFTLTFLGGPIAAWLASRQHLLVPAQQISCPDCGTPSELEEQAETWPLGVRCKPCRSVFWISPVKQEEWARQ